MKESNNLSANFMLLCFYINICAQTLLFVLSIGYFTSKCNNGNNQLFVEEIVIKIFTCVTYGLFFFVS